MFLVDRILNDQKLSLKRGKLTSSSSCPAAQMWAEKFTSELQPASIRAEIQKPHAHITGTSLAE